MKTRTHIARLILMGFLILAIVSLVLAPAVQAQGTPTPPPPPPSRTIPPGPRFTPTPGPVEATPGPTNAPVAATPAATPLSTPVMMPVSGGPAQNQAGATVLVLIGGAGLLFALSLRSTRRDNRG
ncbi:MAG TPA: hypothetical protein VJG32_11445 [Anaerolineae bacterium]|nr:hypothetical protein [Anaerolineae bacterium]